MIWERRSGLLALGVAACVALVTAGALPVHAQETQPVPAQPSVAAAPAETAQSIDAKYGELIRNALAEMAAQHYLEARALFLKAHELMPSARTERGLGSVEFELQHYTWAALHFRAALTSGTRPLDQTMRKEVEAALARAESYTGYLHLTLTPADGKLRVDGAPATLAPDGTVWLDIGDHEVAYEAPGYQPQRQKVTIAQAERVELAIALEAAPVAGPAGAVAATPEDSPGLLSRWWFWTAAGVVVTGAVIGIAVASSGEETQPAIDGNLGATQSVLRVQR